MYPNSTTGGYDVKDGASVYMIAMAIVALLLILGLFFGWFRVSNKFKPNKEGLLVQTSSKLGRPTDYTLDNVAYKTGNIMMSPAQLANYYNLTYPPDTTQFVPGRNAQGQPAGSCAVSSVNNAPWDSYFKCNNKAWSKDAIGEALALSSVGSYYLPSPVEDANLHKVVSLAHDPVSTNCANAAGLKLYHNTNPSLAGVIPPAMRANN